MRLFIYSNSLKNCYFVSFLVIVCCVVFTSGLRAQNPKIDSLKSRLTIAKTDSEKTILLNSISDLYLFYLPPRAADYANQALVISLQQHNLGGIAESYKNIAFAYFRKDQYDEALKYTKKAMQIFEAGKNQKGIRDCNYLFSLIFSGMGDFNTAMKYSVKSLKECQEKNDKQGEARMYYRMGTINRYMENYPLAISYLKKGIDIMLVYNDIELGMAFYRLGDVYGKTGNELFSLEYYNRALLYSQKLFNRNSEAYALNGLGNHFFNKGDFEKAMEYYNKAIAINEQHENYWAMLRNYNGIGTVLFKTGRNQQALEFSKKSLELSQKINDKYGIQSAYKLLYQIYEKMNDTETAFKYHKLYSDFKDSIFNTNTASSIVKMQINFENEKEIFSKKKEFEKQQAIAQEQIQKQKIIIYSAIAGGFLLLLLLFVAYYSYKQKQRSNKELSSKNQKIESAHRIIEEKTREITDSIEYAKYIQQAVLLTGEYADKILGDHFILFKPKDVVSGDFFWGTKINELLLVTVADCTGHGVPGAFMSMLGVSFLNEIVRKKENVIAGEVLDLLRNSIIEALKQKGTTGEQRDGMDLAFCIIDLNTLEMQFAGANNPCWIVSQFGNETMSQFGNENEKKLTSDGQFSNFQINQFPNLIELNPDKQPIGIHNKMRPFTTQKYQLQKGDIIYLKSDGYEDQFGGPERKKFLSKNLKSLLMANSQQPMADQKQILETTLTEWMGGCEQIDDITVLGVRI